MTDNLQLLDAILRRDLASFIAKVFETLCPGEAYLDNWHINCLASHLAPAASGKRMRLIVNLPPRSLKSIAASVALPAWLLGHDPSRRIITVSYSDELARKHARDTRTILESDWYRRVFPAARVNPRKNTETEFTTTRHGFRLATSIGGTLTGRGGDVLIIDDPIKPAEAESEAERRRVNEWYDKTLHSRLDNKEAGVIILMMQRLHEDDLTGHLVEKGEFEVLALPAIATEQQKLPIGEGRVHQRLIGEPLHPLRESLETLSGHQIIGRLPRLRSAVPAIPGSGGREPVQGRLARPIFVRSAAGDLQRCRAKLGHRDQARRNQRLFRLHDLGHPGEDILPPRRPP